MKIVGVSVCSSLCTAVFVVACTASADKMDDDEHGSDDGAEGDVSAAELAELAAQIDDLVAFQTSALCFIGHMTDDVRWNASPEEWIDISFPYGSNRWDQGPNSDSQKAYDDCF